ncbi:MAG: methylmalonyl-CoA mutase family protein [Chitinophagaceae bacterium]
MDLKKRYSAEEINRHYHQLLEKGTKELSVLFDLPTQTGHDSDHDIAEGEVGKAGVAIDSMKDMETLFKGIKLEDVSTSMTASASGFILLAFYVALAKIQGADLKKLSGTLQNDILEEYITKGTYIYPVRHSIRIIADVFEWCSVEVPKWNAICISGYHIREAGSTAVQEIAFALSNGKAYVQAAMGRGLDINVFGKRLSFLFNAHNNTFEEVAKGEAARRIWAKTMKDLGATDEKAMMLRFNTLPAGSSLKGEQPVNNMSRLTLQALPAVAGDCHSPHTNRYDEVLTDEVEMKANQLIAAIDAMGGSVSAIEQGFMQEQIARNDYECGRQIENREKIIIDVNKLKSADINLAPGFEVNDSIWREQTEKLILLRRQRNPAKCDSILQGLNDRAAGDENIMPAVFEAVENQCTLGEIADTLREVYGEYR